MRRGRALACLLLLHAMAIPALAQDATITGDTFVSASFPANNFGALPNLNIGGGSQALVRFDVAGTLPGGILSNEVRKAVLRVWVNKITTAGAIDVSSAASPWTELGVTLSTSPLPGALVAGAVPVSTAATFITVDVTAAVKNWVDFPAQNHGFVITASASQPSTIVFLDSKENTSTSHLPQLIIMLAGAPGAN